MEPLQQATAVTCTRMPARTHNCTFASPATPPGSNSPYCPPTVQRHSLHPCSQHHRRPLTQGSPSLLLLPHHTPAAVPLTQRPPTGYAKIPPNLPTSLPSPPHPCNGRHECRHTRHCTEKIDRIIRVHRRLVLDGWTRQLSLDTGCCAATVVETNSHQSGFTPFFSLSLSLSLCVCVCVSLGKEFLMVILSAQPVFSGASCH